MQKEAASVGGLFHFKHNVGYWHIADKTIAPGFVAYWTNNGQRWISARVVYDAIDPQAPIRVISPPSNDALRPNLRVLYTTGNTVTDKMKALLIKGMHFLCKPYTQHQLQNSIEELVAA